MYTTALALAHGPAVHAAAHETPLTIAKGLLGAVIVIVALIVTVALIRAVARSLSR